MSLNSSNKIYIIKVSVSYQMISSSDYSKVKALMFLASNKFTHSIYRKEIVQMSGLPKIKAPQIDGSEHDRIRFVQKFKGKLQNDDIINTSELHPIQRGEVFVWLKSKFKAAQSHVILVYSGHGHEKDGNWCAETATQITGDRFQLKQIIDVWKTHKKNVGQSKLVIVMDSCHSGHWCCQLRDLFSEPNIAIFASAEHTQKSKDIQGGILLRTILGTNAQFEMNYQSFQEIQPVHRPVFFSNSQTAAYFTKDQLKKIQQNIFYLFDISSDENPQKVYIGQSYQPGTYNGERNIHNQRHGQGIFVYQNGDKYVGQWENDQFHGNGIFYFSDPKGKYSGTWVNHKIHGEGVLELEGQHKQNIQYNHGRRIN